MRMKKICNCNVVSKFKVNGQSKDSENQYDFVKQKLIEFIKVEDKFRFLTEVVMARCQFGLLTEMKRSTQNTHIHKLELTHMEMS